MVLNDSKLLFCECICHNLNGAKKGLYVVDWLHAHFVHAKILSFIIIYLNIHKYCLMPMFSSAKTTEGALTHTLKLAW